MTFSALATTIYHFWENDNEKFHKYQSSHHTKQQTKRLELCIIMAELGSRIRNHILSPIFVNHNRMSKRFYNKQLKRRSYFFALQSEQLNKSRVIKCLIVAYATSENNTQYFRIILFAFVRLWMLIKISKTTLYLELTRITS